MLHPSAKSRPDNLLGKRYAWPVDFTAWSVRRIALAKDETRQEGRQTHVVRMTESLMVKQPSLVWCSDLSMPLARLGLAAQFSGMLDWMGNKRQQMDAGQANPGSTVSHPRPTANPDKTRPGSPSENNGRGPILRDTDSEPSTADSWF